MRVRVSGMQSNELFGFTNQGYLSHLFIQSGINNHHLTQPKKLYRLVLSYEVGFNNNPLQS